jgi:quinol monooxygenase YgiN
MDKYYIVATVYPKAGKEDAVRAEILKLIPDVRKEKGCLRYDLHVLKDGGSSFMFYEIWEDRAAFEAHGAMPHMMTFRENVGDLLEKPVELSIWSAAEVAR